jgi:hypothetical protein
LRLRGPTLDDPPDVELSRIENKTVGGDDRHFVAPKQGQSPAATRVALQGKAGRSLL